MNIRLFDYQEEMLGRILGEFRTHRAVMAQMPTGTGKTYLLAAIVKAYVNEGGRRLVLIVAHRRELVEQIETTCMRFGLSDSVVVKSIQWLRLHLDRMEVKPGMIVIDEAHHALAKTYRMLWEAFPLAKILGLTATPYRLNGRGFEDLFEVLVTSHSVREFIRMKRLSLFDYVSIKGDSEEQRLVDSLSKRGADGDFQIKEMGLVLNNRPTIEKLFQTFSKYAGHKKGIVYAIDIAHARAIAEFYQEHGVNAVVIDSKTPKSLRQELLERFRKSSFESSSESSKIASSKSSSSSSIDACESSSKSSCSSANKDFSNHPVPLSKEGSTSLPKPLAPQEQGDVAGCAPTPPEFWYRQRSLYPQGVADDCLTQYNCDYLMQQSCDCLCGVNRLADNGGHERRLERQYDGLHERQYEGRQEGQENSSLFTLRSSLKNIQVLVNVDIFSEGFDCPDVEVVQLARPTLSLAKYLQMVGRGLRVSEGKECCTIIDNVGLYRMFGLPSEDWDWQRMFLGWKKKDFESLRGGADGDDEELKGLVALQAAGHTEELDAQNEDLDREVGLVVSHDVLRRSMEELPKDFYRYEVRHNKEKRRLVVWDTWNHRKEVVNIFCNEICHDRRGLLLNCCTGYRHWDAIDLKNMHRYPVGDFPSAKVCYFGDVSLLKINSLYITRTQKPYTCVFPINERDVEWHGFYLLLRDPQSQRPLPVCVLAQDDARTYWWIAELEDGGICVMDDEEHFFFAYPDKAKVRVSQKKGRALMPSEQKLQRAAEEKEQEHQVEVKPVGSKVALYVDGKMVVPPIYRKMEVLEHGYCKVQVKPLLWGLITMVGKVVLKPDFADIKVIDEHHATVVNLIGKEKNIKI